MRLRDALRAYRPENCLRCVKAPAPDKETPSGGGDRFTMLESQQYFDPMFNDNYSSQSAKLKITSV
jgi:hypothetical protein